MILKGKEKEIKFREYFYSNLTEAEIKSMLNLNYKQYDRLLKRAKRYYGLPPSYRRTPNKYFKYDKNAYYIIECNMNDFTILGYYPLKEFAEKDLDNIDKKEDYTYRVEKASDENLLKLIEYGFIVLQWNWEKLLSRTNMPHHSFYKLFNRVKAKRGVNINREDRYVYRLGDKYKIAKYIDGKTVNFGVYKDKEFALRMRDYLEEIGWNKTLWEENQRKLK